MPCLNYLNPTEGEAVVVIHESKHINPARGVITIYVIIPSLYSRWLNIKTYSLNNLTKPLFLDIQSKIKFTIAILYQHNRL